jgi:hypothetical protein
MLNAVMLNVLAHILMLKMGLIKALSNFEVKNLCHIVQHNGIHYFDTKNIIFDYPIRNIRLIDRKLVYIKLVYNNT